MSKQNKQEESKWSVLYKRVRLWEGRPQPGALRSFVSVGGSDSGRIEYNGSSLRFIGKKLQIDIPAIKNISEVRPSVKPVHFIIYFVFSFIFFWLLSTATLRASITNLLASSILALLGTFFSWWYMRKYGGWVWITYTSPDGQPKDVGFWGAPASGGSQRLFQHLIKLFTPKAPDVN